MAVAVNAEIPKEGQSHLWGVRNVTQWPETAPPVQSVVLPWELTWLKTPLIPFKYLSGSSALTEEIVKMFEQLKEMGIRVPVPDDVWQYFEKHPHLIEVTRDLAILARERLPEAVMSLEISRDPEGDEEYLVLYARFRKYDETVMKKIRAARKEFLSLLSDEREWPLLTTDFRSPQEAE